MGAGGRKFNRGLPGLKNSKVKKWEKLREDFVIMVKFLSKKSILIIKRFLYLIL